MLLELFPHFFLVLQGNESVFFFELDLDLLALPLPAFAYQVHVILHLGNDLLVFASLKLTLGVKIFCLFLQLFGFFLKFSVLCLYLLPQFDDGFLSDAVLTLHSDLFCFECLKLFLASIQLAF